MNDKNKAIICGGCFWGIEENFRTKPGIILTEVGYAGGKSNITTYEEVCSGLTGHAECVKLFFDEKLISYEKILELFFKMHDPTQKDMQYPDIGTQYRSEIFYLNDEQKNIAKKIIEKYNKKYSGKVVTKISQIKNYLNVLYL